MAAGRRGAQRANRSPTDARKLYFDTDVSGRVPALGGSSVKADVTLDPLVVSAGVGYRF